MARKNSKPTKPNLVCPYTGRTMTLAFDDRPGHTGWCLDGGLDITLPFLTEESLMHAVTMRRGRTGTVKTLKCAYTGTPLVATEKKGLWYALPKDGESEVFSPTKRMYNKDLLLWMCSRRNGVEPGFDKPSLVTVTRSDAPEEHEHFVDTTEGLAGNASDDKAREVVDRLIGD